MYVEKKYTINWMKLFLKSIMFVVIILLVIWLGSSIILRLNSYEKSTFNNNIMNMKEVSLEYFSMESLPSYGEIKKVTLGDLIDAKLILPPIDSLGRECDRNNSFIEVTNLDNYYSVRVELSCTNNTDSVYTKIKK